MRAKLVNEGRIKDFISWKDDNESPYRIYGDFIEYKGRSGWKKFPYPKVYDGGIPDKDGLRFNSLFDVGAASNLKWKSQEPLGKAIGYEFISGEPRDEWRTRLMGLFRKRFPTPKDYMEWNKKNLKAGIDSANRQTATYKHYRDKDKKQREEDLAAKLAKQSKEIY